MTAHIHQLMTRGMPVLFILNLFWQGNATFKQATTTQVTLTTENVKNHHAQHWNFRILDR